MFSLPLVYFRPTVVCLDDDPIVATSLKRLLNSKFNCLTFTKPEEFMHYLSSYKAPSQKISLLSCFNESEYNDLPGTSLVEVNLKSLKSFVETNNHNQELAVFIVDYLMPGITGIDICKGLTLSTFKKLLLTGAKDYEKIIDAMNNGFIDQYFSKEQNIDLLSYKVEQLTFEYFYSLTSIAREHLEVEHKLPISDRSFTEFFLNLFNSKGFVQYYLLDKNGSMRLKDSSGNDFTLTVQTDRSLEQFLNSISDDKVYQQDIVKRIRARELIPCFEYDSNLGYVDINKLKNSLFEPIIINGDQKYFVYLKQEISI